MAAESLERCTKTCIKCDQEKPLSRFHKKKTNKDGLENRCSDCRKAIYQANRPAILDQKKQYYQDKRANILEYKKEYCQRNRENRKTYSRAYYLKNREDFLEKRKAYYEANREGCLELGRRWNLENRERVKERNRQYREANRESLISQSREYYTENRKALLTQKQEYYLANRDKIILAHKERYKSLDPEILKVLRRNAKAKRKSAEGEHSLGEITDLFERQKGKCANCRKGLKGGYHADHIVPIALGGSNYISNIQLLCPTCNLKKHAKDPVEWANENGRLL